MSPRRIDEVARELLTANIQKQHKTCFFCWIPLPRPGGKIIPHASFCPWRDEVRQDMLSIIELAVQWKEAMLHRMVVYDETRALDGVEYQMDPFDPDVTRRQDARIKVRRAETLLMRAIGPLTLGGPHGESITDSQRPTPDPPVPLGGEEQSGPQESGTP